MRLFRSMEYQIKISKEAERDLLSAKCHYKITNLEKQFDADFMSQIQYLKVNPFLTQLYYRNIRRIHFNTFRYSIHYIVQDNTVFILRILHHKQKSE